MANHESQFELDDELLSAYVDNELTADERRQVELRLENDPAARQLVAEMQSLSATMRQLPPAALGASLREEVLAQVDHQSVTLPTTDASRTAGLGGARRWMWAAMAVAAALLLSFFPFAADEGEGEVAVVRDSQPADADREVPRMEAPRGEAFADRLDSSSPAPIDVPGIGSEDGELLAGRGSEHVPSAVRGGYAGEAPATGSLAASPSAGADVSQPLMSEDAPLGVVHLTLTDFRRGNAEFDRLLASNRIQLVHRGVEAHDGQPARGRESVARGVDTFGRATSGVESYSAAPTTTSQRLREEPALDDADVAAEPSLEESSVGGPEAVLVEADTEQIEQLLLSCSRDTALIEAVDIEQQVPRNLRQQDWQQWQRGAPARRQVVANGQLSLQKQVAPSQQALVTMLNSIPLDQDVLPSQVPADYSRSGTEPEEGAFDEARVRAVEEKTLGRAAKLQLDQLPHELQNLQNLQVEAQRQQGMRARSRDLSRDSQAADDAPRQQTRVLFFLHPPEDAR